MNKKKILILMLAILTVFSGCGGEEKETADEPQTEIHQQISTEDPEIKEFFDRCVNTDERPIAVMIDNDDDNARPQEGLNDAYLVYEMVVEGGSTRFMALYRNTDTEKIGPVRSSRHYYLDYVMENAAIYTHYGWSPKAMQDISSFKINNINGVSGDDDSIFWRERKYRGDWHSAYTSIDNISDMALQKGYETKTNHNSGIKYSDSYIDLESGENANAISLRYSNKYTTGYTYNSEKGVYEKTINNKPHLMQSGEGVEFKNIIIQFIGDTSLGDGSDRRNIKTAGSGKGYYITGGKCVEITWSKASRSENTTYKKSDGTELLINPGKTIINIISPSANISIN